MGINPHLPILPSECLNNILSFVEKPRDLWAFCESSTIFRDSITIDMVVKAVMAESKNGLVSMTNIYNCYKKGSVWPMSAKTILKMALSKKCLVCKIGSVHSIRKSFGVNICWHCLKYDKFGVPYEKGGRLYEEMPHLINEILEYTRCPGNARYDRELNGFEEEQISQAERFGFTVTDPLMNGLIFINDKVSYFLKHDLKDDNDESVGSIVSLPIVRHALNVLYDEFNCGNVVTMAEAKHLMDEIIREKVGAPSLNDQRYEAFIEAYEGFEKNGRMRVEEKIQMRKMATDRFVEMKTQVAKKAIERIKEACDDP